MKLPAGLKIALPFALALLGLVALGTLSYQNFAGQRDNQRRVEETLVVLDELEDLQSLLQYALRGASGYLLSGGREFVELFDWAVIQLPAELDAFRSLKINNLRQQERLRDLAPFVAAEMSAARNLVLRYERGKLATGAEVTAVSELRSIEGRLESAVAEMRRSEERLLKEHQALATTHARKLSDLIVAFVCLAVFLVALTGVALWRDFSARRRFEAALKESDARNRAILDTAQDGIITFDERGILGSLNPAAERMFGYAAQELIGKRYTILIPEADRERGERRLAGYIDTGRGLIATGQEEVGQRKDGSIFSFEYSVGETRLSSGRRFTAIVRDVTRRKRAEQALRESTAKLAQSNRDLESFAAVAAHDLQEPLRKIKTFGERLQVNCSAGIGEQGRDYLERMVDAAGRMGGLIKDILQLSRVSAAPESIALVDLDKLARDVAADLDDRLTNSGARIEVVSLPTVEADPVQMRQLLQNLIANALKFRQPEVAPLIELSSRYLSMTGETGAIEFQPDGVCQISVVDNGIGFDEKYLDRIFNPFQRLHGRGQYEGTGIGLAICRRIVERHGGTITARSAPGRGAAFLINLPVKQRSEGNRYGRAA
jgi:two-component system, LuxR family, sensor kinase FixL